MQGAESDAADGVAFVGFAGGVAGITLVVGSLRDGSRSEPSK